MTLRITSLVLLLFYPFIIHADFISGGEAYISGDYETAANEFTPLAKRGDHRAMYALGSMYAAGQGVEKDLKKAFELFSEASRNGRADATYKLGYMYEHGMGIKKNYKKAIRYYQKAAKKGYPLAQYRMGLMYKDGLGVKQNTINAYAWLVIAGHYFIYVPINTGDESNSDYQEKKRQINVFHQQELDRVFGEITKHLQNLKQGMTTEDIERVKQKVTSLSKYRKQYHSDKVRNLEIEPSIETLFLPETLY